MPANTTQQVTILSLLKALKLPTPPGIAAAPDAKASQKSTRLTQAAEGWRAVHREADKRIDALKAAIKAHYADAHPEVLKEVEMGAAKLDAVLDTVDHELADLMVSAAGSLAQTELQAVRALLTRHISYVASERLIAHMDDNPFGVSVGLKALLRNGLTEVARAIS
jgi:hypothetical protein